MIEVTFMATTKNDVSDNCEDKVFWPVEKFDSSTTEKFISNYADSKGWKIFSIREVK